MMRLKLAEVEVSTSPDDVIPYHLRTEEEIAPTPTQAFLVLTLNTAPSRPSIVHAAILSVSASQLEGSVPTRVRLTAASEEGDSFIDAANRLEEKLKSDARWSWVVEWLRASGRRPRSK